jgi:hypothetical protein
MTFEVAKHAVGVMVLLLTVVLLLTPVPLSNVAPAMVISLISLAYVEEDGLVLSIGFLAAIILIADALDAKERVLDIKGFPPPSGFSPAGMAGP